MLAYVRDWWFLVDLRNPRNALSDPVDSEIRERGLSRPLKPARRSAYADCTTGDYYPGFHQFFDDFYSSIENAILCVIALATELAHDEISPAKNREDTGQRFFGSSSTLSISKAAISCAYSSELSFHIKRRNSEALSYIAGNRTLRQCRFTIQWIYNLRCIFTDDTVRFLRPPPCLCCRRAIKKSSQ